MKGSIANLMRQAQQMQENLQKAQEELASVEVTGQAGGGVVSVTMTGRHEVRGVTIDETLIGDDKEMLEDLLVAAINDAVNRVAETTQQQMAGAAEGMGLPAGMKLPF